MWSFFFGGGEKGVGMKRTAYCTLTVYPTPYPGRGHSSPHPPIFSTPLCWTSNAPDWLFWWYYMLFIDKPIMWKNRPSVSIICIHCWRKRVQQLKQVLPKVILEEPHRQPSRERMDSPAACASCAMPTADESNHSAAGTLHPHRRTGWTHIPFHNSRP